MLQLLFVILSIFHVLSAPFPEEESIMDRIWQASMNRNTGRSNDGRGVQVIEMDIVNTPRLQAEIKALRSGVLQDALTDPSGKWPKNVVPYVIAPGASLQLKQAFSDAIREFHTKTCIKFVPRSKEADYIFVFPGEGCYSNIGRQGGKQDISLGTGCERKGVAIHEMMHAIGFFHEQSRRDRDSFINVLFDNIKPEMRYNFDMYMPGRAATLGEPYDKKSVMHYGNRAFSLNGQNTIVSLSDPKEVLGQRQGMSDIDVRQINKHYKCPARSSEGRSRDPQLYGTGTVCSSSKYDMCLQSGSCARAFVKSSCAEVCRLCAAMLPLRDEDN